MRWILTTALMTLLAWTVPADSEEGLGKGVVELECWDNDYPGWTVSVRVDFDAGEVVFPDFEPGEFQTPFLHESEDTLLFLLVAPPEQLSIEEYYLTMLRKEDWSWQWATVNESPIKLKEWKEGSDPVVVEERSRLEIQEGECRRLN